MPLASLARLLALIGLAYPAISLWLRLRKTAPEAANRYLIGIIGMFFWTVAGVVLMAVFLPENASPAGVAGTIGFLLCWIGLAIVAFLAWSVTPEVGPRPSNKWLRGAGIALATGTLAGAALMMTNGLGF